MSEITCGFDMKICGLFHVYLIEEGSDFAVFGRSSMVLGEAVEKCKVPPPPLSLHV
ncbi:hypothetical protein LguiB_025899 [Lonicera macranthoides]